jgi:catechol 2,3-dioxygenase-like lactoylglutathione lyase family enzyme
MSRFSPRLSLITLGVSDIARARMFYENLGFTAAPASVESTVFFELQTGVLALYGRDPLAKDIGIGPYGEGFSGITLSYNTHTEAEVEALLAHAVACGARLLKPAHKAEWGGTIGYFSDPDGHIWEVAHNPFFTLHGDGRLTTEPPPSKEAGEAIAEGHPT